MNIDKSTTEAILSMATDMRAAQKAVESLSTVDLKNPDAWSEYCSHRGEIGFIEDLKSMENIVLNIEDVEERTSVTISMLRFMFYNVYYKLSMNMNESASLAELYKGIEDAGYVKVYGTYTCLDSMENRISGSSYETKNFTRRMIWTMYHIVNSVFHCSLNLNERSMI